MEEKLLCFFCNKPASLVAFYQKYYSERGTIENPVLSCIDCYLSNDMKAKIGQARGGREGIANLTFQQIGKMKKKT